MTYISGLSTHRISDLETGNSTQVLLGSGSTFTGEWEEVTKYATVAVAILGGNITDGTLYFDVSQDGGANYTSIPHLVTDTTFDLPKILNVVESYVRIRYVNGSVSQTGFFHLLTKYSNAQQLGLLHSLSGIVKGENTATLSKSMLTGQLPNGTFKNVRVNNQGELKIELPKSIFDDLRTVELSPQFSSSFEYTVDNTQLNINTITNSGTVTQADAMAVVSSGTTTNSKARLNSKRHARYRSGFGSLLRFTTLFTIPVAGTEQFMGLTDELGGSEAFKNGLVIGYDGITFGFHRFYNDNLVSEVQSSWNDSLDGEGFTGDTLIQTNLNVWYVRFEYLGAGSMELWWETSSGEKVLVHVITYANANTVPSSYNPNYLFTMFVDNKATTSNLIIKCASYAYFIEGKTEFINLHQPQFSSGSIEKTTVTTEIAIFTIRNKATYAGKTNFIDLVLEAVTASIEASNTNNLGVVRIVRNATLGGTPSYSDINSTDSIVEIDTAGTTVTGGIELAGSPLAGKNDKAILDVLDLVFILEPGETMTFTGLSAAPATIDMSCLWKELF